MSCWFGMSPTPLTRSPFSVSEIALPSALPEPRLLQRVAVQFVDALGHPPHSPVGEPRALADAVAGVYGAGTLRAEIGAPGGGAAPGRRGQHLAVGVSPREALEVGAVTHAHAGDEERHRLRRRGRLLRDQSVDAAPDDDGKGDGKRLRDPHGRHDSVSKVARRTAPHDPLRLWTRRFLHDLQTPGHGFDLGPHPQQVAAP